MARAKTPGLKKFNIYLPVAVVAAVDHLAVLRNTTRAELVRAALRDYAKVQLLIERGEPEFGDMIKDAAPPRREEQLPLPLDEVVLVTEKKDDNRRTKPTPLGAIRIGE